MDFKPGKGRKVAFWRVLAEAEGLPPPKSARDYAKLYRRWRLYGYADSELAKKYIDVLRGRGYRLVNEDADHCVCGAPIKYRWLIVNKKARLYAFVGKECKERFFLPEAKSSRAAIKEVIMVLGNQIDETEEAGLDTYVLELLLGQALRYAEKLTRFKEVYVSRWFAKNIELNLGIKWKWTTWEDVSRKKRTALNQG